MTQLGKYDILEELGRGGFGIVYKARDLSLDRVVALKVLHPQLTVDPSFLERFRKEARALARVNHPNVVTIYEIGELEGRVYIAMEYLSGGSLGDRLQEGPLSLDEAIKITGEAGAGLGAGHEEGLVHRDVKPGNVLFNKRGEAVVADFGLAKALQISSASVQSSIGMVGTPYYRAPELWRGSPPPSPATDVYSLGCVLFEMLTGHALFQGDTPDQLITKHLLEDAQSLMAACPVDVPANIKPILRKALAKEPSQRYQSMGVFMSALAQPGKPHQKSREQNAAQVPIGAGGKRGVKPSTVSSPKTPRESQAATLQKEKSLSGAESTASIKQGIPAWLLWTVVGVMGVVLVLVLALRGVIGGRPEPFEVAQEIQAATEVAQERQASTDQNVPTSAFEIGSTMVNQKDGAEMVYVPAGEFLMGSEDSDADSDEAPEHMVYLDAYWIYKHEVTNAQYRSCIEAGECSGDLGDYPEDNFPAVYIDWYEADAYCQWADGRLPTEAEWEKAARGTDGRKFPWGNTGVTGEKENYCDVNCEQDWQDESQDDGYTMTAPVGSYPDGASPYGALDMAGNVLEWVRDWYDEGYYSQSPSANPQGPDSGGYRVIRGGSWLTSGRTLRASSRGRYSPEGGFDSHGFRCFRSP